MQDNLPRRVVEKMLAKDRFSAWLGVELVELGRGRCVLRMTVRDEMLNGFDACHGGVSFSLADSALAFASNSHGRVAVSIENSMAYPRPVRAGDVLTAIAEERSVTERIGIYEVRLVNQSDAVVGVFRGTVFRTEKEFFAGEGKS